MKTTLTIDAVSYDWVYAQDSLQVAHKLVKPFYYRHDIERFVDKAIASDRKAAVVAVNDPFLDMSDDVRLKAHLVDQIEKKNLLVQLAPIGNNAPKALARPKQPGTDPSEGISPMYTGQMREFITKSRRQSATSQSFSSQNSGLVSIGSDYTDSAPFTSAPHDAVVHYKYVVEISGSNHNGKQRLILKESDGSQVTQLARQDSKNPHRSQVEFKGVANTPKNLYLDIPMSGGTPNLQLMLLSDTLPVNKDKTQPCWDTVIGAIKPLRFLSDTEDINESDILPEGWLYLFWRGKCWRELFVRKTNGYQDVALDWYRHTQKNPINDSDSDSTAKSLRKANGHWLENIWIPLQLDGTAQTGDLGLQLAFSPAQWPLEWIDNLEKAPKQRQQYCTSLDGLGAYLQQQNFQQCDPRISDVETALLNRPITSSSQEDSSALLCPNGRTLKAQRNHNLAAVYLQPASKIARIKITNKKGIPWTGKTIIASISGKQRSFTVDDEGYIDIPLLGNQTLDGTDACIRDNDTGISHQFSISLGTLAAVNDVKGQQSRLNNLAHNAGVEDGLMGKNTRAAIRSFQTQHTLDADGIAGPITQKKLIEIHGC